MATTEESLHIPSHSRSKPLEYSTEDGALRIFGFWVFLVTDMLLFSCFFATYAVLYRHISTGPTPSAIFDVRGYTAETLILLTSSFTSGIATYEMRRQNKSGLITWTIITLLLGLSFIGLEVSEFWSDVVSGATMQTSAFLSAFFTLVGTHGCHVSFGIIWITSVLIQVIRRGITPVTSRKVFITSLYWHFLDVVWVFLFTVVYMIGGMY
ncbi:cytochrome (ubi)quinol oxidase subunit III [Alicyclobacillus sp. SO9]|uniref:cytochrome (ubi)quinol oxidase subunit III n=1 Tax=Alicyclobacillus sp. SO9 TaxID=2665646 RepID=UPI00351BF32E